MKTDIRKYTESVLKDLVEAAKEGIETLIAEDKDRINLMLK